MNRFRSLWCVALLFAAVMPAFAQEAEDPELALEEFFDTYDQNDDAKVTIAEMKKAMAEATQVQEGDISITVLLGPLMCAHAAGDTDDDGFLTKAEYRTLVKKRAEDPKYKPPLSKADIAMLRKDQYGPVYKMVMESADTDKDGKLSKKEYLAVVEQADDFDKADANKDDFITKAEMEAEWLVELGKQYELPKDADLPKEGDKKELAKGDHKESGPDAPKEGDKEGPKPADKPADPPVVEKPASEPQPDKTEPAKEPERKVETPAPSKPDSVYSKPGRKWTTRHTTKIGDIENVSYRRTEVVAVGDTEATIKVQFLDKEKKLLAAGGGEQKLPLAPAEAAKPRKPAEETIKVAAGEFECTVVESSAADSVRKEWHSKKYPGLVVKVTTKDDTMALTIELVEFTE